MNTTSEAKIKLYGFPQTRTTRARWILEELQLKYETVEINLREGKQKSPEYLAINPMGAVPALDYNGKVIYESAAIVMWLADKYIDKGFAPDLKSQDRMSYTQWFFFATATLEPIISSYFLHNGFLPENLRIEAVKNKALQDFPRFANIIEKQLENNTFLLGNHFYACDIMIGSLFSWAIGIGLCKDFPKIADYVTRLKQRSAFKIATS